MNKINNFNNVWAWKKKFNKLKTGESGRIQKKADKARCRGCAVLGDQGVCRELSSRPVSLWIRFPYMW